MIDTLIVRSQDGGVRTIPLADAFLTVGRSRACTIHFPDDMDLSRQHLQIERVGTEWFIEDLGSKNGTRLNGRPIHGRSAVTAGDIVDVGRQSIEIVDGALPTGPRLIIEDDSTSSRESQTIIARLEELLDESHPGTEPLSGGARIRALVKAGRELAGHRPLDELFNLILDLALQAVGCTRGMLLTGSGDALEVRATRGDTSFRMSSAVRERVMDHHESLLVVDAQTDETFRDRMSIVEHNVRSIIAVPLQTNSHVIGMIYVDSPRAVKPLSRDDLNLLTVLANVAALRIEHVRLVEVEHAEQLLAKELQQAAEIQRGLLPVSPPFIRGLDSAGFNAPCRTVGGDYYDFFEMDDGRLMTVVGDVAGKGMPAALLMANLQARVQLLSEECRDVACMVTKLNRALALHCPTNRFITFFACSVNPWTGALAYGNAGHNPPIIAHHDGRTTVLSEGGLILGIQPSAAYAQYSSHLNVGDVLLLYSDGVTEMTAGGDSGAEDFGVERLSALAHAHRDKPAQEIIGAVIDALRAFSGGAASLDDVTLVAVKRTTLPH